MPGYNRKSLIPIATFSAYHHVRKGEKVEHLRKHRQRCRKRLLLRLSKIHFGGIPALSVCAIQFLRSTYEHEYRYRLPRYSRLKETREARKEKNIHYRRSIDFDGFTIGDWCEKLFFSSKAKFLRVLSALGISEVCTERRDMYFSANLLIYFGVGI